MPALTKSLLAMRLIVVTSVLSLFILSCTASQPTQAISTPAIAQLKLETTSAQIPTKSRLGQLLVEYPILLQPGANKTVNFQISLPAELANSSSDTYKPDIRPADSPRPMGKYREYTALILVNQRMHVELVAPNFAIQQIYPSAQDLDMETPNAISKWGWIITAPSQPNEYVLVLKVYASGNDIPIWVGSFDVSVQAANPTPGLTPTPFPTPQSIGARFVQNIADNAVTLIGALLTTMVAVLGLYLQNRKNKTTKK